MLCSSQPSIINCPYRVTATAENKRCARTGEKGERRGTAGLDVVQSSHVEKAETEKEIAQLGMGIDRGQACHQRVLHKQILKYTCVGPREVNPPCLWSLHVMQTLAQF